jgi:hypothetical protein
VPCKKSLLCMRHTVVSRKKSEKDPEGSIALSCGYLLIKEKKITKNSVKYYFAEVHMFRVLF